MSQWWHYTFLIPTWKWFNLSEKFMWTSKGRPKRWSASLISSFGLQLQELGRESTCPSLFPWDWLPQLVLPQRYLVSPKKNLHGIPSQHCPELTTVLPWTGHWFSFGERNNNIQNHNVKLIFSLLKIHLQSNASQSPRGACRCRACDGLARGSS